jgi:hypothetical protein
VKVLYDAAPLLMRSAGVKNYHYAVLQRLLAAVPSGQLKIFPYLSRIGVNVNEQSNFSYPYSWLRLAGVLASNRFHLPFDLSGWRRSVPHHAARVPSAQKRVLTSMIHDATADPSRRHQRPRSSCSSGSLNIRSPN